MGRWVDGEYRHRKWLEEFECAPTRLQKFKKRWKRGVATDPRWLSEVQGVARTLRPPYRPPEQLLLYEHNGLAVAALIHFEITFDPECRVGYADLFLVARDNRFRGCDFGAEAMRRLRDNMIASIPTGEGDNGFPFILSAVIHRENYASQRLVKSFGFEDTGQVPDRVQNANVTSGETFWEAHWIL